ncbi:hypothetical protein ABIC30_000572 [Methylobacterium sp. 1030]
MSMSSPSYPPGVWAEVYLEEDSGPRHVGRYHFGVPPAAGEEVEIRAPVAPGSTTTQSYAGHIQAVIQVPSAPGSIGTLKVSIDLSRGRKPFGQA